MKEINDILIKYGYFIGFTFERMDVNFDNNSLEIHIKNSGLINEGNIESNPFLLKLKFLHIRTFGWDNSKYYSMEGNVNLSKSIDHVILKCEEEGINYLKICFKDNRSFVMRFKLFNCITFIHEGE